MTPEEHIELAERIIDNYRNDTDALKAAEIHVRIAEFKKRYPSDAGRPVARSTMGEPEFVPLGQPLRSSGRMHDQVQGALLSAALPGVRHRLDELPAPSARSAAGMSGNGVAPNPKWSEAKQAQWRALSEEPCPGNPEPPDMPRDVSYVRHGLQRVTSRSWRDLFRKRSYWRCWFCDLREEVVE